MKNIDTTLTRIHQWVTGTFPLAQERQLGLDDSLLESGIIDSLGTLEVVQFLEDEFAIRVEDEEMLADYFDSVQAIAQFVTSKQLSCHGDTATR